MTRLLIVTMYVVAMLALTLAGPSVAQGGNGPGHHPHHHGHGQHLRCLQDPSCFGLDR